MKNFLIAISLLVSGLSMANEQSFELATDQAIKVGNQAHLVNVLNVTTENVGQHGFPVTQVFATATFGNSCSVPRSEELVSIVQHANHYETLIIALGFQTNRICTAEYQPVTVTLDLGRYTKPNDGHFSKIIVNGKTAR